VILLITLSFSIGYLVYVAHPSAPRGLTLRVIFGEKIFFAKSTRLNSLTSHLEAFMWVGTSICDLLFGVPVVIIGLSAVRPTLLALPIVINVIEIIVILTMMVVQEIDQVDHRTRWFSTTTVFAETGIDCAALCLAMSHAFLCVIGYYDLVEYSDMRDRTQNAINAATTDRMRRLEKMIRTQTLGVVAHF
jgi:hypothetical protein